MYSKASEEYYFFAKSIEDDAIVLGEDEFHHITKVLRLKKQTEVTLTDGRGKSAIAEIQSIGKKHIEFDQIQIKKHTPGPYKLHMAIAPTKNINRFEWYLEKATEIGISEITPLLCEHSERKHIRADRLEKIIVAACKQSKKVWKPVLNTVVDFNDFVAQSSPSGKYIAYLGAKVRHLKSTLSGNEHVLLIGPEGGFSENEYRKATAHGFTGVSLGVNRLRTETAGVVGTQIIAMHYD